jgi:4-amino-4-deoxy-L-arabinose transferase-like glycosyltransferase
LYKPHFKDYWKYLLVLLLISFPIFLFLDALTIRLWDESRLAINAYEMFHNGSYLIPTFDGVPDMWNTKPPLMIWLQVLSMKVFGINEWAIRFPSAVAAFLTCIVLLCFSTRYVKSFWFGAIWTLVLVTSSGYVEIHAIRTGDYDALLAFVLTLGSFSFFVFLENSKPKFLYLFFISMALAVLTKSSATFIIIPGLLIYAIIKKKLFFLLKNKHLYIGLSIFLISTCGYYFIRETYNPGYIKTVMINEFGGRFLETIEEHKQNFWYYFGNLFDYRFIIWVFFVPAGIVVGRKNKDERVKSLTLFASIIALTYFLVISSAQTKLPWYVVPMYPFLALLVGTFVFHIFLLLKEKEKLKYKKLSYIFLIVIFIAPYSLVIGKIYQQQQITWKKNYNGVNYYLRNLLQDKIQNDNFTILFDGNFTHGKFYLTPLQKQGKNILLKNTDENIEVGEVVLFSQSEVKLFLEENFEFKTLEEFHVYGLYEIVGNKN